MLVPLPLSNLGVELGQLAFALRVAPVLWWLARGRNGARAQEVLSIGGDVPGLLWFTERAFA